ncbi:hypothetical protein Ctob_010692 [Chrysochromulina tobinii]|uniref:C2H2-type domain-containing protein n=1 Tax=Chrysochromulina tobinii TaxID=1460289 RepID=A0A0M0K8P4_9EUKA|nr:hypothetical protein Ctob_010692 [Chrysochromulina tobinii]|eukprot:KOO35179.1 hypothetical protein Ctob_010692 [Chrysochromulina sp. CCMP291]
MMTLIFILALGVPFLYGGEADEVIRFMEQMPAEQELNDVDELIDEEASIWLQQVEEEKRLIEALPVVIGAVSFFYHDVVTNLNKVQALVGCCWASGQLKRVKVNCDETGLKPTHLEALRGLRMKIMEEHMCEDHVHHHKAVERVAERRAKQLSGDTEMPEAAPAEAVEAATAFDRMKAAAARQQALVRQAAIDAKAVEDARRAVDNAHEGEKKAQLAHQEAKSALDAAKAMAQQSKIRAEAAQIKLKSHKKQKTAFAGATAAEGAPADNGSKYRIALMLAEMAVEFGVVDEVAEHLNLKHSAEEIEKAKVDGYIVDRLRAAINVYKRCLTEAMRIDLHVILGAVAPERKEKAARETRKDEKAEKARPMVEELFNAEGARSPSQRDRVRRRVGIGMYECAQALYIYSKYAALYSLYLLRYSSHRISFSLFKRLRPWYVRRTKERTCECKHCTNFKNYMTVHHSLEKHFGPLLNSPTADADALADGDEDDSDVHEWEGKAGLTKLLEFCALQSKSEMVKFALCKGALDGAGSEDCINGKCARCGFDKLWSKGLRKHVIDGQGNIKASAPIEFQAEFKWLRIRSSKNGQAGEPSQPSYEQRRGTVVEFLDDFEASAMRKFPHHRFTIMRQKDMAAQFERNPTDPEQMKYGVCRHGLHGDSEPELEFIERRYLRHRKLQTKVFAHVSDDKTHDSHAAQTFLEKTFAYLEEHYVKTGKEKFFAWHMHSDNAPSHFKSSKTMHFFSKLRERLASWASGLVVGDGHNAGAPLSFRVFWEFGPPGHGKGVWDGIGAWLKRTVREDITDHRPGMKTILLEKGTILSPEDVATHLKMRFDTDAFIESHQGKTINQVIVLYTPTNDIIRPKPDHEYDKMPGMKKTFLFMGVREGVILQRKFACWCTSCMHASAPGEGTMDSNYCCSECESESLAWEETSIDRR